MLHTVTIYWYVSSADAMHGTFQILTCCAIHAQRKI